MDSSPSKNGNAVSAAAQHIRELNAINEKVPDILSSARAAIESLSASAPNGSSSNNLQSHQEAFTAATRNYFSLVLSVKDALEAQTKALEEAGIISSKTEEESDGRHMGLGVLDVGWLNERRGDVGRGFEGELMAEVRKVVEKLLQDKADNRDQTMSGT